MDAVEYVKSYRRICGANACTKCPLWVDEHYACMMDAKVTDEAQLDESKVVSAVEQWSKDYPTKTRQSEFLKMFPNAFVEDGGVLSIPPCNVDRTVKGACAKKTCSDCHREFWLQEVE